MHIIIGFCILLGFTQAIIQTREVNLAAHSAEIACQAKHGQFEKINTSETMCTVKK